MSSDILYNESRINLRVKEKASVFWQSTDNSKKGKGRIRNISSSGMLFETDRAFNANDHSLIFFDPLKEKVDFIPETGRLVWQKKNRMSGRSLCGIEFVDPDENILSRLRQRIQKGINRFTRMRKVRTFFDVAVFIGTILLMAYVLWLGALIFEQTSSGNKSLLNLSEKQAVLTQNYVNLYRQSEAKLVATQKLYQESTVMLDNVTEDLASTKSILAQTESMLSKTRSELDGMTLMNQQIKSEFAAAKVDLENTIALLEEKSVQLNEEISQLNKTVQYYEGNIADMDEGKALIKLYREKMRLVKSKIYHFRKEAQEVKSAAQRERDRIRSIVGNNGYFMKDGNVVNVDIEKFNNAILEPKPNTKSVDIDVKFFE